MLLAVDPLRTIADDQFNTGTEGPNAAVVGTRLVVADPTVRVNTGDSESPTGLVRLYDLNTGAVLRTLPDPEPNKFGEFGKSVAPLGADRVVVGDPGQRSSIFGDPGLAKVFIFDANSGSLVQTIADPTVELPKQIFSRFGSSVAGLGADRILVGEPAAADGGKVYLFDVASGTLLRTFNNPSPGASRFGDGLTPLGGNLFASAGARVTIVNADTGAVTGSFGVPGLGASSVPNIASAGADRVVVGNSGAGYLIDTSGALVRTLNSPDPALTGPSFATEVAALDDGTLLLAAPNRDNSAIDADAQDGAVYLVDPNSGAFLDVLINPAADSGTFPAILETAPGGLAVTGALTTSFSPFAKRAAFHVFDADPLVLATVGGATLLDGGAVDFGTVVRGQTGPVREVVLANPSATAPLNLSLALPAGYTRVGGGGSNVSIAPGATTTLSLRLSDTAQTRKPGGTVSLTAGGDAFTFSVTGNVALALVPDGGTTANARTVAGATGGVGDVNVTLNISHPQDDDLQVFLVSPSGTRVQLFANVGTFTDLDGDTIVGRNFVGTKLDDDARRQSNSGPFTEDVPVIGTNDVNDPADLPPFTGVFKPQGGTLATFDNEPADGSWTLELVDTDANGVAGSLDSWELQVRAKGLRFLDENGVLLDEFDSIAFSTDDAPIELSGDPGPAKRFFIRNDGDVPLAVGDLEAPTDETGTLAFTLLEAPPPGLVLQPGESTSFLVQQLFTEEGSFGDNLTMGGSAERFVVTGAVRRPVGRPEMAMFRNADGQPVVDNQPTFVDFGTVPLGATSPAQVFLIKNFGAFDPSVPPDPSVLNIINMNLPAGFVAEAVDGAALNRALAGDDTGFYAVRIRMLTDALGNREGPVVIDNNDADEAAFNFPVKGSVTDAAVPPEVDAADTSGAPDDRNVVLDTTQIGTTSGLQTFTLRNLGAQALDVTNFAKGGVNGGEFGLTLKDNSGDVVNNASFTIAPGQAYTIEVRFSPAGAGGRSGNVTFNTNDPDEGAVTLTLVGNGSTTPVENAEIDVRLEGAAVADGQPVEIDFGTTGVGQGAVTRTFVVRNLGLATLNLGTPVLPDGFTLSEPLSGALAPGAQDEFTVTLDDSVPSAARFGSVRISSNDPDETTFDFPIRGAVNAAPAGSPPEVGVSDGAAALTSGQAVPFGSATQGAPDTVRTFTVTNQGGSDLTLGTPVLPAGFVLVEPLNGTIPAGGSDSFQVALSGSTPGSFAGNLTIATDDLDEGSYALALSGTVIAVPGVSVSEVVPGKLPGQPIVGGDKRAKGTIEVRLGNTAPDAVSGGVIYALFLSTDPVLGGAPDVQIGTLAKNLKLKAGATPKPLKVKVTIPALDTGDYFVIAQATGAGITGTSARASAATLRVERPVVRFPTVGAGGEPALVFGRAATLPITLANQGNVDAKGTATLRLSVSPADQPGTVVFTQDLPGQKLSVKRGASKAQKVKVTFAPGQFAPGRYVLTVRLSGEGTLASVIEGGDTPVALLTFTIA